MKRIIALTLVLCSLLLLVACNNDVVIGGKPSLEPYKNAIAATSPKSVKLTTTLTTDLYEQPLTGEYNITFADDGSATVEYSYTLFNEVASDAVTNPVKEYSGTATIDADGNVTGDDEIGGQLVAAARISFNLDDSKMTYSASSGTLTANIKAENTAAVLGAATGADTVLTVSIADGVVVGATITYETSFGPAVITCTYNK